MAKNRLFALLCLVAAFSLHYRYFRAFSSSITQPYTGRRLILRDSFTFGQFGAEALAQLLNLGLSHLLPAALLFLALKLYFKDSEQELYIPRWLTIFCYAFAFLSGLVGQYANMSWPISADEFSYVFQSRVLHQGSLSSPGLGLPDFVGSNYVHPRPWMSVYPIGWSAFLALFPSDLLFLGPPLVAVLALVGLKSMSKEVVGENASRLAVFFTALSPGFYWQSASFFPHVALLAAWSNGAALYLYAVRNKKLLPACLAGLVLSWGFVNRPVETGLFGAVALLWYGLNWRGLKHAVSLQVVLVVSGLLGCTVTGIAYLHAGGFYPIKYDDPPHHFWASIWNGFYSIVRMTAWWLPFYLTLLVQRFRQGGLSRGEWFFLLQGACTAVTFTAFVDNGQIEYGARYWLAGWALCSPVAASAAFRWLQDRGKGNLTLPIIALSIYSVSVTGMLFQEARARVFWPAISFQKSLPENAVIFLRSASTRQTGAFIRNVPGQGQTYLLFLDPKLNKAVREIWKDRPAYIVDWTNGKYQVNKFEDVPIDDANSLMRAADHTIQASKDPERAISIWERVPTEDPYFVPARLNLAVALFKLKRSQEGLEQLQIAEQAGASPQAVESIKKRFAP